MLVIDEVSMLRAELFEKIEAVAKAVRSASKRADIKSRCALATKMPSLLRRRISLSLPASHTGMAAHSPATVQSSTGHLKWQTHTLSPTTTRRPSARAQRQLTTPACAAL